MVGCLTEPNACFPFKFLVCLEKIKTKNVVSLKKKNTSEDAYTHSWLAWVCFQGLPF